MEEIITAQSQALDNIEPQTQAANATNAKVIKIKKCHAWFAVGYHYYFAVVISIDCALVAFDYKRFIK
jgi:hypothetical protein